MRKTLKLITKFWLRYSTYTLPNLKKSLPFSGNKIPYYEPQTNGKQSYSLISAIKGWAETIFPTLWVHLAVSFIKYPKISSSKILYRNQNIQNLICHKKDCIYFRRQTPVPFKKDLAPRNDFSPLSGKIQFFLEKLLNNKFLTPDQEEEHVSCPASIHISVNLKELKCECTCAAHAQCAVYTLVLTACKK